jgi:hypothetical protein
LIATITYLSGEENKMENKFSGKIRLVFSMTICMLFVTMVFSSAGVKAADADWNYWSNPPNMFSNVTGKVGIGTSSPLTKFHVKGGAVLFSGGTGGTPTSGAGRRFMWIPSKAAFRAGYVSGNQWNNVNIGLYSVAMGDSTTASGYASTAMGLRTTASGYDSTAMGAETSASGDYSTTIGVQTIAGGGYSTAMGAGTRANGSFSTSMGRSITVNGDYSVGIGLDYHSPQWFINSAHVMSIMGGKVGINTTNPAATLDVGGNISINGKEVINESGFWVGNGMQGEFHLIDSDFIFDDTGHMYGIMCAVNNETGTVFLKWYGYIGGNPHLDDPNQWNDWVDFGSPDTNSTIDAINLNLLYSTRFYIQMIVRMSSGEIYMRLYEYIHGYYPDDPSKWNAWVDFGLPSI